MKHWNVRALEREFEVVIGLEIHAHLLTESKLFCACSTRFGAPPNSHTCPVCLGLPGALPVVNQKAVGMAIQAALSLGCKINRASIFARKNYFYPDLPKGYQISQFDLPLAEKGSLEILTCADGSDQLEFLRFGIHRVHLEDDAGKSIHRNDGNSYVDLNRTGVPLIEIVTEPDLRTARQAQDFLSAVHKRLLYLGVCDGNMEQGSLRCDANISLREAGEQKLGTKAEIKNLNSFRFLRKALEFEIDRQAEVLGSGGTIHQETRLWDEERQKTFLMRSKEFAHDYRYFPDPDLLPVRISQEWLEELEGGLPELPEQKQHRLIEEHKLSPQEALQLTQSWEIAEFFEEAVAAGAPARTALNWILGDMARLLKLSGAKLSDTGLAPQGLANLIQLVDKGAISNRIARQVFGIMIKTGEEPEAIAADQGWSQISDQAQLSGIVGEILLEHPREMRAYREGKTGLLGFFVGQVMARTRGQANPKLVNELLQEQLGER